MSQLPRDPRQLARDILSGKIKLEDLAREKARQQMSGGISPTARVPSPRPPIIPAPPRTIQTTPARPIAFPPRPPQSLPTQRRPAPAPPPPPRQQFPQRPAAPGMPQRPGVPQRPAPPPPPQRPRAIQPPPRIATQSMASRTAQADRQSAQDVKDAQSSALRAAPLPAGRPAILAMLANRQSLRTGILLAEILAPPVSLRDER